MMISLKFSMEKYKTNATVIGKCHQRLCTVITFCAQSHPFNALQNHHLGLDKFLDIFKMSKKVLCSIQIHLDDIL